MNTTKWYIASNLHSMCSFWIETQFYTAIQRLYLHKKLLLIFTYKYKTFEKGYKKYYKCVV